MGESVSSFLDKLVVENMFSPPPLGRPPLLAGKGPESLGDSSTMTEL